MLTADKVDLSAGCSIRIGWLDEAKLPRLCRPTGVLGDSFLPSVVVLEGNGVETSVRTCRVGVIGLRQGVAVEGVRIWNFGGSNEVSKLLTGSVCTFRLKEAT